MSGDYRACLSVDYPMEEAPEETYRALHDFFKA
jgi:hypothetical protein